MKGFLRCFNKEYDYSHQLRGSLDAVDTLFKLSPETAQYVIYLNDFSTNLRYRSMSSDPTAGDAKIAIAGTKQIMREFEEHPDISKFMKEAEEVHSEVLKSLKEDL